MKDSDMETLQWILTAVAVFAVLLLASDADAAENFDINRVTVLETGEPYAISWCNATGQQDATWTVFIDVLEFPPKEGAIPIAGTSRSADMPPVWTWTPEHAGAYYVRAMSCQDATCSHWGQSVGQEEVPGCVSTPEAFIYYVKLKALTGGGID